jgi:hypothetical protein
VIAASAGRRVGSADDDPRFSPVRVPLVRERIGEHLRAEGVTVVVCAAANGADLLLLNAAAEAGLRRRIVLPHAVADFRTRSVSDRPGPWTELYDRLVAEARASGDLVLLGLPLDDPGAIERCNAAILDEAELLGAESGAAVEALVIWDGVSRGPSDHTNNFVLEAQRRSLTVRSVLTV